MGWVMPTFTIVAAVALFIQMCIFFAMFIEFRRVSRKVEAIAGDLQTRINPMLSRVQTMIEETQPRIAAIVSDAAEMTHVARAQVHRVDRLITETTDRLRLQLVHADEILTGALDTVEETGSRIRRTVWAPVQSISAVFRGIQTGLEFYRGRRRRADGGEQDEGLFI